MQENKITEEAVAAYKSAKKEEQFSAARLLQEIAPLLEEYFIGTVETEEQSVTISFPNGQKYVLQARELE